MADHRPGVVTHEYAQTLGLINVCLSSGKVIKVRTDFFVRQSRWARNGGGAGCIDLANNTVRLPDVDEDAFQTFACWLNQLNFNRTFVDGFSIRNYVRQALQGNRGANSGANRTQDADSIRLRAVAGPAPMIPTDPAEARAQQTRPAVQALGRLRAHMDLRDPYRNVQELLIKCYILGHQVDSETFTNAVIDCIIVTVRARKSTITKSFTKMVFEKLPVNSPLRNLIVDELVYSGEDDMFDGERGAAYDHGLLQACSAKMARMRESAIVAGHAPFSNNICAYHVHTETVRCASTSAQRPVPAQDRAPAPAP